MYHPSTFQKLPTGTDLDTSTVESFLREGLIMKDFNHRHVLSLVGVSIDPLGVPIIVLPFMANGNLKKYLMKADIKVFKALLVKVKLYEFEMYYYGCLSSSVSTQTEY